MVQTTERAVRKHGALKTMILAIFAVGLGLTVIFCVIKVGDINGHAALLQGCIDAKLATNGCPPAPVNAGQIATLHNTADTLGHVGWISAFMLLFVVGSEIMNRIRN
jgi:hypothetical protein